MSVGTHLLNFAYDASGAPMAVTYDGVTYYYVTNLQGDIIAILDGSGNAVVQYMYDAWGKLWETTGSMATTLGVHNPLRYRAYVYDPETALYYLQSRYYDPEMGRFINADAYTATGQGFLGNNMFAYCGNNPVIRADEQGTVFFTVLGAAIGAGVGALDAWMMGGDMDAIMQGAKAGAWSGGIAGAGVDVGVLVVASGGTMGVALGIAAGAGAIGGVVGTGISTDWQADPLDYTASAIVTGGLNMVSFGLAPINGEILKGTIKQMITAIYITSGFTTSSLIENTVAGTLIAEATTWITRAMTRNNQRTVERQ